MNLTMVVLRLLHIVLGVFWAGTLIFVAVFLGPAVGDAGPDGAKVMAALQRRRFLDIMPLVGIITVLTGIALYWKLSNGFTIAWMRSPTGTVLGIGAVAALVALGIGVGVLRPRINRSATLAQELATTQAGPDREAKMATLEALRKTSTITGRWIALLLALAASCMAIARYV